MAYGVANRLSADASAIVPHDSVSARPNDGLDDLEGDDVLYNGANMRGDPSLCRSDVARINSPQLPSLPEEPNSPSCEGIWYFFSFQQTSTTSLFVFGTY